MIKIVFFLLTATSLVLAQSNNSQSQQHISEISVADMSGNMIKLSDYSGNVLLIVNVASECGYTPQYDGLQKIYDKYNKQGFEILAFPCNDFGAQEPGSNQEIQEFCTSNYGVKFKLFDKIAVLGEKKSRLYNTLTTSSTVENGDIKWNFEKFLIDDGKIVKRFRSKVQPESEELIKSIESLLTVKTAN